jgi:hypothetical protein
LSLNNQSDAFKSRADFLLSRALLARGQITRGIRLSEVGIEELDSALRVQALRFTIKKSKTNKFQRTLHGGLLRYVLFYFIILFLIKKLKKTRHKDLSLCGVSAVAFHFLQRFHVVKEKRPDLKKRQLWYNRFVLKGNGDDETTYVDQRETVIKGFEAFGINCSKKTHLGRDRGTADCAHGGVPKESMERQGFWNLDALTASYLSRTLPVDCLKVLAGFKIDETYFLNRDLLDPPEELQSMIFPWLIEVEQECKQSIKDNGSEYSGNTFCFLFFLFFLTDKKKVWA